MDNEELLKFVTRLLMLIGGLVVIIGIGGAIVYMTAIL